MEHLKNILKKKKRRRFSLIRNHNFNYHIIIMFKSTALLKRVSLHVKIIKFF